tara:strand:+ start:308 stop:646 length:339 start_codon:yes stop_codon:yes gene_type:complete
MAFQDITGIKMAQEALTTAYSILYTTPTSTRTYVKDITVANTTSGSLNVFVHIVPDGSSAGTANALLYTKAIAAYDIYQWSGLQIMNANDTLQAKASGTGLTINVSGANAVE